MRHSVHGCGGSYAKHAGQCRQQGVKWPQIAAEKAADELRRIRPIAAFDHRWRQLAGRHVAKKAHRLRVAVAAFSLRRIGEEVGVTMWNNQHIAGFEVLWS